MLETYAIEATEQNWLGTCLTAALLTSLARLDEGEFPAIFPADAPIEYREVISRFTGIVERFNRLMDALAGLNEIERGSVRSAIETQNRIPEIFDGVTQCSACKDTLPDIHDLAKELFKFSFKALSSIKTPGAETSVRDIHFQIAYHHLSKKCCPCCGMERLEPPHSDIPRPDLDHYLHVSQYPFCGANLKNLVPMGDRCNSSYKLAKDILFDQQGNRLLCYDPYGDATAGFSLAGSKILGTETGEPIWNINLGPESPQTANWDRIFGIKIRLEQSLNAEFASWANDIGGVLAGLGYDLDVLEEVSEGLIRYRQICGTEALFGIGHLKAEIASLFIQDLGSNETRERTHAFLKEASS
ncbi:hypothetical protein PH5382_03844 [Phaeobacter sp. CECT 5382]|uniref:hypothetical protein n=1 Tax=Phaeobacter sp. CECT 5382 TaxID=1712645 RepID=UPI0006D99A12|nr:hypothetical protein [Phaeobacter sp. CECT 5382]CUH89889.1 hypothetical protein PH5382_03844 [Phaeobacter sp. CECT 5382]